MSGPNAARTIPPGDRDDAPELSFQPSESIAPQAPRQPDPLEGLNLQAFAEASNGLAMAIVALNKASTKLDCNVALNKIGVQAKAMQKAVGELSKQVTLRRS